MTVEINNTKTIREIQEAFTARFPFLKLEFFRTPHERDAPTFETPCDPELTLGEVRERNIHGVMTFAASTGTGALEQDFRTRFDLNVQVYRLQAGQWIQTAGTDMLTLGEQNAIAQETAAAGR
jgi:hypothetical protein